MEPEGEVKEMGLEGIENLKMGFSHLRTTRGLENELVTIHPQGFTDYLIFSHTCVWCWFICFDKVCFVALKIQAVIDNTGHYRKKKKKQRTTLLEERMLFNQCRFCCCYLETGMGSAESTAHNCWWDDSFSYSPFTKSHPGHHRIGSPWRANTNSDNTWIAQTGMGIDLHTFYFCKRL